jgi:hypothetical protein
LFFSLPDAPGAICILPIARSRDSQGLALILGIGSAEKAPKKRRKSTSAEKVLASTSPAI